MKILDRHLLSEFLTLVLYCLVTFTTVFVVFDLFDRMDRFIDAETPSHLIVVYYALLIGPALHYLAPASLMLAALYTLYQLSRHSELIAMRACGVSIYRIIAPFIAVGFIFSLLLLLASETMIPYATEWTDAFRENRFKTVPREVSHAVQYYNAFSRRQWSIGAFNPRAPEVLLDVDVMVERENGSWDRRITAEKAEWLDGQWWLTNAKLQRFGRSNNPSGQPVPLGYGIPRIVQVAEFDENPTLFRIAVRPWESLRTSEMMAYMRAHPALAAGDRTRKRYDIGARFAMPWAGLIVILFAIPAGARTGRQGTLAVVFSAIGMLVGYYSISQIGLILGVAGWLHPWIGAWMSNCIFLGLGIGMLSTLR